MARQALRRAPPGAGEAHRASDDDEAADVSAAGRAASAGGEVTPGDDPELVEAAEAAQRPDEKG